MPGPPLRDEPGPVAPQPLGCLGWLLSLLPQRIKDRLHFAD